jgi:hypothetical protein
MTTTFKTYARAIDARSFIEARDELASLTYELEAVTIDGKRRYQPVFYVAASQRIGVETYGFKAVTADEAPAAKEPEDMPQAKTMAEKAMLADLTVKGWSGRATDNEAAAFTAQHYQANAEWTKFTKRLVNADALKAVKKAEAAARATHKELTLPWNENGQRILPAPAFQDYMAKMGQHRDDHEAAVDAFIAAYDSLVEEARRELGGLFNADDYPDAATLQAKFVFDTELTALDTTGDFRVSMSDAEMEALQAQITKRTEARLNAAMTDVYQRLHEVVAHMADRLKAYKPKRADDDKVENPFRDATLNNVRDIVDLMPKLNITNDPDLDALAAEVRQNLLEADAATLRSDDAKRADVAAKADEIAAAMAGMM